MAPTSGQIAVALDALRADADQWRGAAAELGTAAGVAGGLTVAPAAFSFAGQAVAAAHEALRSKLAALLTAGAANFDDIAAALRASADAYEADEIAGAHRLRDIY
ncbi:MAG: type VII secretion target [Pseudonocardia sp.]